MDVKTACADKVDRDDVCWRTMTGLGARAGHAGGLCWAALEASWGCVLASGRRAQANGVAMASVTGR